MDLIPATAMVTNGFKTELIIDKNDELWIRTLDHKTNIYLGSATKARCDQLIFNLQQMKSVCT